MAKYQRQAIIKQVTKGELAGQLRFKLIGDNGEPVGGSWPETYKTKQAALKTLRKYFPTFEIVFK